MAVGSRGETLRQTLSFLGSPTVADVDSSATQLLGTAGMTGSEDHEENWRSLSSFNGVRVGHSLILEPSFQQIAATVYGVVAESFDFQNQPSEVTKEVNECLEGVTNGLIKDLIPGNSVTPDTIIIPANALYFKGKWAEKFESFNTKINLFRLLNGSCIQVPFMTTKTDQFVSSSNGFKVARLPFQQDQLGRSFSMLLFLTDRRTELSILVKLCCFCQSGCE